MVIVIFFCIAYLIGSIPSGYIVGKIKGIDLKKTGYKRIGASNVYKSIGFLPSVVVFFADFIKGIIVILIGSNSMGLSETLASFGGIIAVIGHNWPVWLKFKGEGRGVATSCGLVFYLFPRETVILIVVFMIITIIMKHTPLPFFVFFLLMPVMTLIFKEPVGLIIIAFCIFLLFVFARIAKNIKSIKSKHTAINLMLFDTIKKENEKS